jgi:hypothetical protein
MTATSEQEGYDAIHLVATTPLDAVAEQALLDDPPACPFWCIEEPGHPFTYGGGEWDRRHRSAGDDFALEQNEYIAANVFHVGRVNVDLIDLNYWYDPTPDELQDFADQVQAVLDIVRRLEAGR